LDDGPVLFVYVAEEGDAVGSSVEGYFYGGAEVF
jgi:hypothetical protein